MEYMVERQVVVIVGLRYDAEQIGNFMTTVQNLWNLYHCIKINRYTSEDANVCSTKNIDLLWKTIVTILEDSCHNPDNKGTN